MHHIELWTVDVALRVDNCPRLDRLRRTCTEHGQRELLADRYPHAGGPQRTALSIEIVGV